MHHLIGSRTSVNGYCVRPDPLGGDRTIIAPLDGVEDDLTAQTLQVLWRPVFRDGTARRPGRVSRGRSDIACIRTYAERGFQAPQEIPDEVWAAFEALVALGFDRYVIRTPPGVGARQHLP